MTAREKIQLTKNGTWLSNGEEITHGPTRSLFYRSIVRRPEGDFLEIGQEKIQILIEDTALFVSHIIGDIKSGFRLRLTNGSEYPLHAHSLRYQPGRLTARISEASNQEARFLSSSYHKLLRHLQEDPRGFFLEIANQRINLAPPPPDPW